MSEQVRVALVGCGLISPYHYLPLMKFEGVSIVGVCDVDPSRASRVSEITGGPSFSDFDDMLRCVKPDVAHILTPHYLHFPMVEAALRSSPSIGVVVEKPIVFSREQGEQLRRLMANHKGWVSSIFQNRFTRGARLIERSIRSGELGEILGAGLTLRWSKRDGYFRTGTWHAQKKFAGGGVLINQAIHSIDLLRFFLNRSCESVSVNVHKRAYKEIDIEDTAEGILTFGDVDVPFYCSLCHPTNSDAEVLIVGERGTARFLGSTGTVTLSDGTVKEAGPIPGDFEVYDNTGKSYWGEGHYSQLSDIYSNVRQGIRPDVSYEDALETIELVFTMYDEARL